MEFEFLVVFTEALVRPLEKALDALWSAYVRMLSLPILAAVWIDCAAGFAWGLRLLGSESVGAFFLGITLLPVCAWIAIASTFAWRGRVEDEEVEAALEARGAAPLLPPPDPLASRAAASLLNREPLRSTEKAEVRS